jgi:hypothetical protein
MKNPLLTALGLATSLALLSTSLRAEDPALGYVDFGTFSPSAAGGQFVEIHIKSNLISMVARLAEKSEPEIAQVLRGLQLVQVNVISLKDDNRAEVEARVRQIRADLDKQGWERVVTAQQKNEDVSIFVKTRGEEAVQGLVVTVLEGNREAVLVNIVGDIRPEKLAVIGERFNIEPLKKLGPVTKK